MESRKIVKSGNTSYTLALPIDWVRRNGLELTKRVQVIENPEGDLVIFAEKHMQITEKQDIITIKVDGKDKDIVFLEILTAYLRDASSIIFEGKEIPYKTRMIIKSLRRFIGLDVMEQNTNNIVVKNFSSMDKETAPPFLIRKMHIMNKASIRMLKIYFSESFTNEDFLELQGIHNQTERLSTLASKSILKMFEHPNLMKKVQTNHLQLAKEKLIIVCLHQISTQLLSLGKVFLFVVASKQEVKRLNAVLTSVSSDYEQVINAIANKTRESLFLFLKEYERKIEKLEKEIKHQDDPLLAQSFISLQEIYGQLRIMALEAIS